ncbi:MAG: hypothetical protein RLZZ450_6279 [Pseudomonadota bacterium]
MKVEFYRSLGEFVRSGRGRWVALAGAGVVATLIAISIVVPSLAEGRVLERLDRMGLAWTVGDTSVGFGGIVFEDVAIRSKGATAPLGRLARLKVGLSWLRALYNPRSALESVSMTDLVVDVDVEQLRELRSKRPASTPTSGTTEQTPLPPVLLERGRFKLRDSEGPLVDAELTSFSIADQAWKAELAKVEMGGGKVGEQLTLESVHASGPLLLRRPQLSLARVDSATLILAATRGSDDATPTNGVLVRRIRKVRSALKASPTATGTAIDDDTDSDAVDASADAAGAAATPLWTRDARLQLRGARVVDGAVSPKRPILEKLNLELLAEGDASLRVRGDGATATGGALLWDLLVTPRDAKIEGRLSLRDVPVALFTPVLPKLPFYELERTRVGANLAITGKGLESASVRGELSISELGFESERIAKAPVGPMSFTARGQATWTPARRELSNLRGEVAVGDARVLITGGLAWPQDAYRIDMKAEMPKTKCASALAIVPDGVLDDLAAVELKGDIKAKVEMHVDSADLDATKLDFDFDDKCKFVTLPEAMNLARFERPFVHRVLEPDDTVFEMETGPGTPAWTPMELISPFMVQAVVAHEDGRFFNHRGFAETEIGAALARNLKAKAFKFGASTITMQLVKNVFLHRDKLLSRKVQEALIVWWLEQQVDKKWILELYLNVIEYGTAVYGIRNAALHYFGVLPLQLTPAQAAFLATILPSPKAYDEQFAKGTITDSTKRKVTSFLQHMHERARIDDEALAYGLEELANFRFYDPAQPPPVPASVRGAALMPPFQLTPVEGWNTFDANGPIKAEEKVEDGSFGFSF